MATAPAKAVSENPLDYARYIVYYRRNVPACDRLVALAHRAQDVLVQDVDALAGERPPWLRGVPSLVALPSFKLYTGTEALRQLEHYLQTEVQAMTLQVAGPRLGGSGGMSLVDDDELGPLSVRGDARYDEPAKEAPATSLEEMMRRRARGQAG